MHKLRWKPKPDFYFYIVCDIDKKPLGDFDTYPDNHYRWNKVTCIKCLEKRVKK